MSVSWEICVFGGVYARFEEVMRICQMETAGECQLCVGQEVILSFG